MSRTRPFFALLLAFGSAAYAQLPVPTTSGGPNSPSLQLPGSLTISAAEAPPAHAAGMPSGNIQFTVNGNPLGTAPLAAIPTTENFLAPPVTNIFGYYPFGLFTQPSTTSGYSALGMLDWYPISTYTYAPEVRIFSGQGASLFGTAHLYQIGDSNLGFGFVDANAVADFTHDGNQDVLLHGFNGTSNEFYVLPGTAGGGYAATGIISTDNSNLTCACSNPTETITVDDFNGDGYPDVAYAANLSGTTNPIGVALNAGAAGPGTFKTFIAAPALSDGVSGDTYQAAAVTSGHLTSSGHADLVVAGAFYSPTSGSTVPGNIAVFLGNGDGTFGAPVTYAAGNMPIAVATADLRNNGITDVVVASASQQQLAARQRPVRPAGTGAPAPAAIPTDLLQVFFNDGKGNLTVSSSVTLTAFPSSLIVTDYNNDGYPDILVNGLDGSLSLLLNDGTGHFSTVTPIGTASTYTSLAATGDFNGDGLADVAVVTQYPIAGASASTISEYLNSAASGAILKTAPETLPAGADTITMNFAGDANFAAATPTSFEVTVTQTTPALAWPAPAAIEYGSPLSPAQLDATAGVPGAFAYTPGAGTVLPPGSAKLSVVFTPTDGFDYTPASASQTITVTPPSLTSIAPSTVNFGSPNTTLTVAGQGFVNGAVVRWNGAALATTWVNLNQLTAVVPASLLEVAGPATVTVADPNGVAVAGSETITVTTPSLSGINPSSATLGSGNTTITVAGQGFVSGAVVKWNGTALATTWVSLTQLTAVVPASLLDAAGPATITVIDPNGVAVPGSQTFTILSSSAVAKASVPTTVQPGQNSAITLTVQPYPVVITATLTLAFTPAPPNTVTDPAVLFPNNTTTDVIQIPADSTAAIPPINFSPGSTAGTITLTVQLTAGGANITPATLVPITITVPPSAPVINSVTLTRSGNSMTVAILGLSSTRNMTQAHFHFTPISGQTLKTTDLTVDLSTPFTTWYQSAASDAYGTTFLYTQPFTLDSAATNVQSVTVTLTNSVGDSQPGTAQ